MPGGHRQKQHLEHTNNNWCNDRLLVPKITDPVVFVLRLQSFWRAVDPRNLRRHSILSSSCVRGTDFCGIRTNAVCIEASPPDCGEWWENRGETLSGAGHHQGRILLEFPHVATPLLETQCRHRCCFDLLQAWSLCLVPNPRDFTGLVRNAAARSSCIHNPQPCLAEGNHASRLRPASAAACCV